MSVQTKLTSLLNNLQSGDQVDLLRAAGQIDKISRIGKNEKQANLSIIKDLGTKIVYNMVDSAEQNLSNITDNASLTKLAQGITQLRNWLPPGSVQTSYLASLDQVRADIINSIKTGQAKRSQSIKEQGVINRIISDQIKQTGFIQPNINILKIPQTAQYGGIQQQIAGLQGIIDNPPPTGLMDVSKLPPTMSLLSLYAQKLGYAPVGTITGSKARAYVGIQTVTQDGVEVNKAFPYVPNQSMITTPSIKQTFRYHAGKTIKAWNNYIAAQQKFITFANEVSSQQKRQTYVSKQLKCMNMATFSAQVLSTLVYYYVYIPLRWLVSKFKNKQLGSQSNQGQIYSQKWFWDNYELPPGLNNNPLAMSIEQCKTIAKALFTGNLRNASLKSAQDLLKEIIKLLLKVSTLKSGMQNIQSVTKFTSLRGFEAKSYLKSIGISDQKVKKIIERGVVQQLIFRRILLPSPFANPQIVALLDKALQSNIDQNGFEEGKWVMTWGSSKIPAYDYIWKKQM